ncbi:3-methyl-2-oxobutanoate hydroxymethyltransferase [Thiotrichales bacterium 19S9-12]|nr:3-methyl-2-oxobutanoate hydroxymethyltransferase [Thiotrichales bacterium 19S9-11]MCF6812279.1 3-methyl-2-oxobutanoate hydroxymethyltransferase [Thiotrichales bacterium 19S9-12]
MNITQLIKKKQLSEKITMVTCYDAATALVANQTDIDILLVGDSVSMVVHGHKNTTTATLDMMVLHTQAVANGNSNKFIVADLPFMSYRGVLKDTINSVQKLIQAGANAIKLEGAIGNLDTINHIVHSGVPVMGHIGMTPQHVHNFGGFKIQGKEEKAKEALIQQAKDLEAAGCFAIVLECIPSPLAKKITEAIHIPTIGIGAGSDTDGQVLVWHDLLGLLPNSPFKFVKEYLNGYDLIQKALSDYDAEVKSGAFPKNEHSFS